MNTRVKYLLAGLGVGAAVGTILAQQSIGRHRRALFSARPLRRLSALGYLSRHPSVEAVRLLRITSRGSGTRCCAGGRSASCGAWRGNLAEARRR
jgi:hypothetical protein